MNEPVGNNLLKKVPKNRAVARSSEGIEVWNRDWNTIRGRLFPEDIDSVPRWSLGERQKHTKYWNSKFQYWHFPAGEKFDPNPMKSRDLAVFDKPQFGISELFRSGARVFEPGCGGGAAAIDIARAHKDVIINAIDYEFGKTVPLPTHHPENVTFQQMDWRRLQFPDNTFDSIYSDQGIALYGSNPEVVRELTRVSKKGAVLRASAKRGILGKANFYELLAELGWDVYVLMTPEGENSNLTIAKLVNKP